METKFYTGNYSFTFGQPHVIVSATESETCFTSEKIIIFEMYNKPPHISIQIVAYPKELCVSISELIFSEIEICKSDILHRILSIEYKTEFEQSNFEGKIKLVETDKSIISLLRDNVPTVLTSIKDKTINEKLKKIIMQYQSIAEELDGTEEDEDTQLD